MKLRRYRVYVINGWTHDRLFWTLKRALAYYDYHSEQQYPCYLYHWEDGFWVQKGVEL